MEDYITVARAFEGHWDWSEIEVLYSPSRKRYFWYSDSGCSCNGFGEYVESIEADYTSGTRAEAFKELRAWGASSEVLTEFQKFKEPNN